MQLIINKNDNITDDFIYNYLLKLIERLVIDYIDKNRLKKFDEEFDIETFDFIKYALKNLLVTENQHEYIIKINKNLKYKKHNVSSVINLITYGTRSVKGYPAIDNLFIFIANHIDELVRRWNNGY